MSQTEAKFAQKTRTPGWLMLVIFASFLIWGYYYLFALRPIINSWLSHYLSAYPAILHLVPIIAVPILVAITVGFIYCRIDQHE